MAIYDLDGIYAERFMEYINRSKSIPFQVRAFSEEESFLAYAKEEEIEILLVSEKAVTEEIRRLPISHIIVLSEETYGIKEKVNEKTIYKYQSSHQIVREVMCYYAEQRNTAEYYGCTREEGKIIGIYSPIRRSLKTTFALTLGQILSEKVNTLYINLEEYSGFSSLFEKDYVGDLSDLIYFMNERSASLIIKLQGIVQSMNQLDYIPPCIYPSDLKTISGEEWVSLLDDIRKKSSYGVTILDMGENIQGLYSLLSKCNIIYSPIREDKISMAKMYQYEKLMQMTGQEEILEKTKKLHFKYFRGVESGLENLVYSDLGDYIRELLAEEEDGRDS